MNISETVQKVHQNAVDKGFWEDKETKNVPELLMLCVSELSEAMEAHRKGKHAIIEDHNWKHNALPMVLASSEFRDIMYFQNAFETAIKNSFEDEIADTVIRIFDLCGGLGIDLEYFIEHKMRYNSMREHKHGKLY